jgi:protein-tyrosine phosphatase
MRTIHFRKLAVKWWSKLHRESEPDITVSTSSRILFVCKGNICRSAYAEERLRELCRGHSVAVASAGLETTPEKEAELTAQRIARTRGLDLSRHRTQRLTQELLNAVDVVFVMERAQRGEIRERFSRESYLLGAFATGHPSIIDDPFGGDDSDYQACFEHIDCAVARLAQRMERA